VAAPLRDEDRELLKQALSPRPRRPRPPETTVHHAADRHVKSLKVALQYAFAMGRRALGHAGKPNADAAANTLRLELMHVLSPVLLNVLRAGGDAGLALLPEVRTAGGPGRALAGPFRMRFDANSPQAIAWAQQHAAELVTQISETTRDSIRTAVERGLKGEGIEAMWRDIRDAVGDEDRAELIARTETMRAASEGQRLAWAQAREDGLIGEDRKRAWITTGDDNVCDECDAMDGETVGLDEEYSDGSDGPPKHPQCRCTEGIV
jgi:SPP1 gp7 family putative phage head morphogenesis protein